MKQTGLSDLKQWFSGYCRSFYTEDRGDQKNILLKEEHTGKVCANILEIASALNLDAERTAEAEVVALFHDVGRFPQYRQYKTFRDSISVNHAALGARVLIENKVLAALPETQQQLIIRAVMLHNVFTIPAGLDEETLLFLRMIRDADKLDIWRVFIEYYDMQDHDRPKAAALGLPDLPEYSSEVLESLVRKEMVHLSSLRTLNDFRLLQLAWIFDLNFERSLQLVRERSYIDKVSASLPKTEDVTSAVDSVREYIDAKLAGRSG